MPSHSSRVRYSATTITAWGPAKLNSLQAQGISGRKLLPLASIGNQPREMMRARTIRARKLLTALNWWREPARGCQNTHGAPICYACTKAQISAHQCNIWSVSARTQQGSVDGSHFVGDGKQLQPQQSSCSWYCITTAHYAKLARLGHTGAEVLAAARGVAAGYCVSMQDAQRQRQLSSEKVASNASSSCSSARRQAAGEREHSMVLSIPPALSSALHVSQACDACM